MINEYCEIESVELINGNVEVVRRYKSNTILPTYPPQASPDTLVKEVYGVRGDKIELISTMTGTVRPPKITAEEFVFNE